METTVPHIDVNHDRLRSLKDVIYRHRTSLHEALLEVLAEQGTSPEVTTHACQLVATILSSLDQPAETCDLNRGAIEGLSSSELLRALTLWTDLTTECFALEFTGSSDELAQTTAALHRWMVTIKLRILHEHIQKAAGQYLEQLNQATQTASELLPRLEAMQGECYATH